MDVASVSYNEVVVQLFINLCYRFLNFPIRAFLHILIIMVSLVGQSDFFCGSHQRQIAMISTKLKTTTGQLV